MRVSSDTGITGRTYSSGSVRSWQRVAEAENPFSALIEEARVRFNDPYACPVPH